MNNTIALSDTPETIESKLRSAVTDENRKRRNDPGNPDICNIYTLHNHFSAPDMVANINTECRRAGIGCSDCKKWLGSNISQELTPVREQYNILLGQPDKVKHCLETGAKRCSAIATQTMDQVRKAVGIRE